MKIPAYKRVTRSEMGKVPTWVDIFLDPIQRQIETLTIAMQNNLTPWLNLASEVVEKKLPHGVEVQFKLTKLRSKPFGAMPVGAAENRSIEAFAWRSVDQKTVAVTAWFGNPDPGTDVPIVDTKLWIFGEGE